MWVVLVVLALAALGLLCWHLFQRSRALLREVSAASRRATDTRTDAQSRFDTWRAHRQSDDALYLAGLDQDVR